MPRNAYEWAFGALLSGKRIFSIKIRIVQGNATNGSAIAYLKRSSPSVDIVIDKKEPVRRYNIIDMRDADNSNTLR
jgi:hypothetical protein